MDINDVALLRRNFEALNRKERFHMLQLISGGLAFTPSPQFLDQACEKLQIPRRGISCVYSAMDYHLDWIYGALYATSAAIDLSVHSTINNNAPTKRCEKLVSATQQDVDC